MTRQDSTGPAGTDAVPDLHPEAVAVVGMAARVPGADDLETFWSNLVDGTETITFFDRAHQLVNGADEWEVDDPDFVRATPVLQGAQEFDPTLFGMSPREAELADPQQRLFLEQCHAALVDAGCDPARYQGDIAVFGGSAPAVYQWSNLRQNPQVADGAGELGLSVGNNPDYIATTVSYRLNLTGPAMTVHTACSTSLVAVHLACEALRSGECDMALAGGVCVELPLEKGYRSSPGFTSGDGHCRPFDALADGTIWEAAWGW